MIDLLQTESRNNQCLKALDSGCYTFSHGMLSVLFSTDSIEDDSFENDIRDFAYFLYKHQLCKNYTKMLVTVGNNTGDSLSMYLVVCPVLETLSEPLADKMVADKTFTFDKVKVVKLQGVAHIKCYA